MNKLVEEEKEERAMQHDDMINRLDRERKDRIRGLDSIQNQLHDDIETLTTKQMRDVEEMRDALEKEDEARQALRNDLDSMVNCTPPLMSDAGEMSGRMTPTTSLWSRATV